MSNFETRLKTLERKVAALERGTPNPQCPGAEVSGARLIILDKEHDRILEAITTLRATYGDHQTWSTEDVEKHKKLVARRNELRKLLGITT